MVNIIMPAYNAHETIKRAIASICAQDDLDEILLTIVDDCSDESYTYILDEYRNYLHIEILRKDKNEGCGQARQTGIDQCKCEYMMFLDADDGFYSFNSVKILLEAIENNNADVVVSNFVEETEYGFLMHEHDNVWMHGKIYRTDFVKRNKLRFNYTRCNEDHVFNALCRALDCRMIYINNTTYVWRNNQKSITRSQGYNLLNGFNDYFINAEYCISEMLRLSIPAHYIANTCVEYLRSMYGYYNVFAVSQPEITGDSQRDKVIHFIESIPSDIINLLQYNNFTEGFYKNDIIALLISNDVPFVITLKDYLYSVGLSV